MSSSGWIAIAGVLIGACATGTAPGAPCNESTPCLEPDTECLDHVCVPTEGADAAGLAPEADAAAPADAESGGQADAEIGSGSDAQVPPPADAAPDAEAAPPPDAAAPDAATPDAAPPPDAEPDPFCGDDACDLVEGETCSTCPADCPSLEPPAGLSPTGYETVTGESVTLDWSPACGASEYDVLMYFWRVSTSSWEWYYEWNTSNDYFVVWPVLSTDFYFQVRAGNGSDTGVWSTPSYFTYSN